VSRIHLGLVLDPDLLKNRHQLVAEAPCGVLGFPYVDDAEAVGAVSGSVRQEPSSGQSAGESSWVLPAVSRRTVSSYFSRLTLGP